MAKIIITYSRTSEQTSTPLGITQHFPSEIAAFQWLSNAIAESSPLNFIHDVTVFKEMSDDEITEACLK